jgi:hypothetical protein
VFLTTLSEIGLAKTKEGSSPEELLAYITDNVDYDKIASILEVTVKKSYTTGTQSTLWILEDLV